MKRKVKRIILIASAVIVPVVLIGVGFGIKIKSELNKMSPVESGEIIDNLFAVNDAMVNFYLIEDNGKYVAFDCGTDPETISTELEKLNINADLIAAIFLTHTDWDHAGGIPMFPNAKVYFSRQDEQLITGETKRMLLQGNDIGTGNYTLLDDRQTIAIGNLKIRGILTPGHTPGSMCYLVNEKYLFTGDALSLSDGKIAGFNEMFNMDTEKATESMKLITTLPEAEYIFTAHYGYTIDYLNAVKSWND